jgi:hypothetical protein
MLFFRPVDEWIDVRHLDEGGTCTHSWASLNKNLTALNVNR